MAVEKRQESIRSHESACGLSGYRLFPGCPQAIHPAVLALIKAIGKDFTVPVLTGMLYGIPIGKRNASMRTKQPIEEIRHFIYTQTLIKKSRLVALIMLPVTAAVIVLQYLSVLPSDRLIRLSNILCAVMLGYIAIKPRFIILYTFPCLIAGLVNIYHGGNLLGLSLYLAGLLILLKANFFKTYIRYKISVLGGSFAAVLITQWFRHGSTAFMLSLLHIGLGFFMAAALFVLFADDLKHYYTRKTPIHVSSLRLTDRQHQCLCLAAEGITFRQIGDKLCISESVIKKEMTEIYKALNVANYHAFLIFIQQHELIQ